MLLHFSREEQQPCAISVTFPRNEMPSCSEDPGLCPVLTQAEEASHGMRLLTAFLTHASCVAGAAPGDPRVLHLPDPALTLGPRRRRRRRPPCPPLAGDGAAVLLARVSPHVPPRSGGVLRGGQSFARVSSLPLLLPKEEAWLLNS